MIANVQASQDWHRRVLKSGQSWHRRPDRLQGSLFSQDIGNDPVKVLEKSIPFLRLDLDLGDREKHDVVGLKKVLKQAAGTIRRRNGSNGT